MRRGGCQAKGRACTEEEENWHIVSSYLTEEQLSKEQRLDRETEAEHLRLRSVVWVPVQ